MPDFDYQFDAPSGTRVLGRLGMGITTSGRLYWCYARRQWFTTDETFTAPSRRDGTPNGRIGPEFRDGATSHAPCRSFKAFKRHLRRHHEKLKGQKVTFVHRFADHDIVVQL